VTRHVTTQVLQLSMQTI